MRIRGGALLEREGTTKGTSLLSMDPFQRHERSMDSYSFIRVIHRRYSRIANTRALQVFDANVQDAVDEVKWRQREGTSDVISASNFGAPSPSPLVTYYRREKARHSVLDTM